MSDKRFCVYAYDKKGTPVLFEDVYYEAPDLRSMLNGVLEKLTDVVAHVEVIELS